jgi:diguanylate cyclase (GGDEF)-like protein
VAALVGLSTTATLALLGPFHQGHSLIAAIVTIAIGSVATILCAPWRQVLAWRQAVTQLRNLAEQVRRVREGHEEGPLPPCQWRDDELGRFMGAVHELMDEVLSRRRDAERLRRRMGDSIKKETHRQTLRLKREALTDPLTSLVNRRGLQVRLRELPERYPAAEPVVAMAVDLDLFKKVNDTLGHETGDACLRFLGDLLQSSVRREDVAVRLGGDEFVVIMPGVSSADARAVAQRLGSLFRQMPWPHHQVERPTLSVGLASCMVSELADGRELLRAADAALYAAKRAGRACVREQGLGETHGGHHASTSRAA